MVYTEAIGEMGATVKQVRKMERLLDAKIGTGGGGGSGGGGNDLGLYVDNDGDICQRD